MTLGEAFALAWEAKAITQKEGSAAQAMGVLLDEIDRLHSELQGLSQSLDECQIRRHYLEIQLASQSTPGAL